MKTFITIFLLIYHLNVNAQDSVNKPRYEEFSKTEIESLSTSQNNESKIPSELSISQVKENNHCTTSENIVLNNNNIIRENEENIYLSPLELKTTIQETSLHKLKDK